MAAGVFEAFGDQVRSMIQRFAESVSASIITGYLADSELCNFDFLFG